MKIFFPMSVALCALVSSLPQSRYTDSGPGIQSVKRDNVPPSAQPELFTRPFTGHSGSSQPAGLSFISPSKLNGTHAAEKHNQTRHDIVYTTSNISSTVKLAVKEILQQYDQGIEPEKAKKLIKISITPNDSIGDIRVTTLDRKGLPTFLGPSISRRGFRPNVTTTISKAIHDLLANTTRGTHRHIQIRISPNESVHRVKVFAERPAHNSTAFPQNTGDRVLQLTGTDKPTRSGGRLLSQEVSNATVLVENGTGNGTVTNGESRDVTKMPRLFGASVELEVDV